MRRTGGDLVVESLAALGATMVFGEPGQHALGLFDALRRSPLRYVGCRTELSVAYAADGHARATGSVTPFLVSTGPGALGTLPALMESRTASVPVLGVSSQIPADGLGGGRKGYLHELPDQAASFRDVVKSVHVVRTAGQIPSALAEAWEIALTVPAGPVWVEIPQDVLLGETGIPAVTELRIAPKPLFPRPELVAAAADLLAGAATPVILAGGGVVRAGAQAALLELSEALDAPVATTFGGKGAFPWEHPLSLQSWLEDRHLTAFLEDADVLLVVGSGLGELSSNYHTMRPRGRLIQVEADLGKLESNHPALALHADARLALEALTTAVKEATRTPAHLPGLPSKSHTRTTPAPATPTPWPPGPPPHGTGTHDGAAHGGAAHGGAAHGGAASCLAPHGAAPPDSPPQGAAAHSGAAHDRAASGPPTPAPETHRRVAHAPEAAGPTTPHSTPPAPEARALGTPKPATPTPEASNPATRTPEAPDPGTRTPETPDPGTRTPETPNPTTRTPGMRGRAAETSRSVAADTGPGTVAGTSDGAPGTADTDRRTVEAFADVGRGALARAAVREVLARVGERLDAQGLGAERAVLAAVERALPREALSFWDMTILAYWAWSAWPRAMESAQGAGGLGYGLPAALGAAAATGGPVLAVSGDGGAMYGLAELATLRQHDLDVTWLIVDDGGYGILREYMTDAFGTATATELARPDFVALAAAFGVPACRTTPENLEHDLARALRTPGPHVVVLPATLHMFAPS
ncbi:thiamine pyrophosphate-dependent enzyme [Nonomuraea sp. SYSU D8015]|uniref:thiamine pyrophosphate-dependent enzyme n=1 Tax=Nonomuraea sp. SYSU D8015 TaxID=2593644 RepID=UPI001CB736BE|nr:thiamine pyrophosphate-dependent enzyme [Nonomuraea sp. SYSU D8015]